MPQDLNLPPGADYKKAEKYVSSLIDLISKDKLIVTQTDLSRFNSPSMEDHYRINLTDYDVELSHNKNSQTGEETFVMIFNSISSFENAQTKPLILSYMHITSEQFLKLKMSSDEQIERFRKKAEEERFKRAMEPVDAILEKIRGSEEFLGNAKSVSEVPLNLSAQVGFTSSETLTEQSSVQTMDLGQTSVSNSSPSSINDDNKTVEASENSSLPL